MFQIATHKRRRAAPDAVRVVPRRAAAADRPAHGRPRDRPAVRGRAGSVRAQPRATGLLRAAAGPDGARPPARRPASPCYGVGKIQDIFSGQGITEGAVLGLERPRRGPDARLPAAARPRRSSSRTWWTSTRSTGTATTRPGTRRRSRRSTGGCPELIGALGRRRPAHHRRPRLRPDDAADRPLAGADAAAGGRAAGRPARDRDPRSRSAISAQTVADLLGVEVEGLDGRELRGSARAEPRDRMRRRDRGRGSLEDATRPGADGASTVHVTEGHGERAFTRAGSR